MIRFKTFLTEARMAPLYHATSLTNAISIIKDNLLKTTSSSNSDLQKAQRGGKQPTVFMTRNYRNAIEYGWMRHDNEVIVFVINQQKLAQKYKLEPIHNWFKQYYQFNHDKNTNYKKDLSQVGYGVEYEEITDRPIKNFLDYVDLITTTNWSPTHPLENELKKHGYNIPIVDSISYRKRTKPSS